MRVALHYGRWPVEATRLPACESQGDIFGRRQGDRPRLCYGDDSKGSRHHNIGQPQHEPGSSRGRLRSPRLEAGGESVPSDLIDSEYQDWALLLQRRLRLTYNVRGLAI